MKTEIVDLFTKRIIDYTLINLFEVILIIFIILFIYAIIKTIAETK